ncbi:hypothetical protein EOL73_00980 [Candidatus Saccharibacteria bacterium]|nr:hypothetical protein [Candidatus Saccharibacteria bacterium]NCU40318.1 hypothetical protein [Candidatus Saccharibacteria bacterium]
MVPKNTNKIKFRSIRPTSPANSIGRKVSISNFSSEPELKKQTPSMHNRLKPGEIRRMAMEGDATLGIRSRYTPIAKAVRGRQAYNSSNSMSVVTRPRGMNSPRAL